MNQAEEVFKFKPYWPAVWSALLIIGSGSLVAYSMLKDGRYLEPDIMNRARFIIVAAVILSGILIIGGTSRFWFRHLYPKRR